MTTNQILIDKTSISLSFLCVIHCLATPLIVIMLPSLAGLPLHSEAFHLWLVVAVLPLSIYALTLGCKKHKHRRVMVFGVMGLFVLVMTVLLGHDRLGENWEKIFTVIGASLVALGHILNYRLCQSHENVTCRENQQE